MTPQVFRINDQRTIMKAAGLFVECLENEGFEYIFGDPGEENVEIMDALLQNPIRFITTRREQGALMADIYGRLSGNAAVWPTTLSPVGLNSKDRDSRHPCKKAGTR
jgi:acetolactate synthase-1/2/3 large subunit